MTTFTNLQTLALAVVPGVAELAGQTASRNGDYIWSAKFELLQLARNVWYSTLAGSTIGILGTALTQSKSKPRKYATRFAVVSLCLSLLTTYKLAKLACGIQKSVRRSLQRRAAAAAAPVVPFGPVAPAPVFLATPGLRGTVQA